MSERSISQAWTRAAAAVKSGELTKAAQIARVLLLEPDDARALYLLGQVADAADRPEAGSYYRARAASIGTTAPAQIT